MPWFLNSNNHVVTARNQSVVLIGWSPPKSQFVKLNTDGAYKVSQVAGCGGVIRGCQGEWLGGFAKCVGLCSAFIAELWGVVEGLRLAHRLGFKKVELNIDSEAVVHVVNNGISSSVMGYSLLQRIRNLLSMDWTVEMKHTYREANKCADGMANLGCTLRYDVIYFNSCPAQISELYHADMVGNSTPRLISL
ncbi:heat shock 70 kDa protein [Trifolium repens]|nr:heat shock 70 kDa protein [Trifolium repens]